MCDLTTRTWVYTRALCLSACVFSFRPRKRRNSTDSVLTSNNLPRAGVRSPMSTPRRSSRMSVITSYTVVEEEVEAAIVADAETLAAVSTQPTISQQSTPASSGSKSARSSAGSSSERRGRRSNQTLQMLSESLGKPSPSPSSASNASEVAEAEPESEPTAAALQQPTRQLQFNDSNEETDSDDQLENEASQESDYVPERADELRCVVTAMLCVLIT